MPAATNCSSFTAGKARWRPRSAIWHTALTTISSCRPERRIEFCRPRRRACWCTKVAGMVRIPRKYRNDFGQLEEPRRITNAIFACPMLRAPAEERGEFEDPRHEQRPQRGVHRAESSVRRRRMGRILLSVRLQSRRVRADHRQTASAAAGARDVRGARRSVLRIRPAALRLSSARDSGAVQPLERRLR